MTLLIRKTKTKLVSKMNLNCLAQKWMRNEVSKLKT